MAYDQSLPLVITDKRRGEIDRADSVAGSDTMTYGRIEVVGSGEGEVSIQFPVDYFERPVVTFGGELVDGTLGNGIPVCNALVKSWISDIRPDAAGRVYKGMTLYVRAGGTMVNAISLHWMAVGPALSVG